ncbi:MAG: non-canonical purine NTP pyrophosphatase [Thermoplasmata archaeon]|nr:non-canonical purine NTP pyrophosphatase [Thermoplasmata archaeon]
MDLRFVSSNADKFREAKAVLGGLGLRASWVRRELPEPQADDLRSVVREKLRAAADISGTVLVEDSGLFLSGLHGFPGVYSAYVLRTIGLEGILRLLRGRPRSAVFRTVAGVGRGGHCWLFTGEVKGIIVPRARGSNGFGYDPIFRAQGSRRTFAELDPAEKNAISHRGQAIHRAGEALVAGLGKTSKD